MITIRGVAWAFGGLIALAGAVVGGLWFLTASGCGNEILAQLPSPDGQLKVVVFQRDCGATTGFSTQLSLLEADHTLHNESGNVFVADTDHGAAPTGPGGGPELLVAWQGNRSVAISHHYKARVFKAESQRDGVSFSYQSTGS